MINRFILLTGLLAAAPLFAQVQAPALPDLPAKSERGLILTLSAGGKTDARAARLVALHVPKGQAASPFVPAGAFTAKWEGEIASALRAEYTFAADIQGAFKLTLNGTLILEGAGDTTSQTVNKTVQLKKGANALVAEFASDGKDDAMIQLKWWSKEFPAEPVPPTVFARNKNDTKLRAGERVREGRVLFAQLRCTACHDATGIAPAKGEGMPELAQDAPLFDEPGAKYNEAFLAHWINDPHTIRPHALMPRVFPGEAGKVDQRAADLAAYFASLGKRDDTKPAPENAPLGGALFANLGCIACHTTPDFSGEDEHARVPLGHVAAKWQPKALREFLKNPAKSYAFNRMPHFRLTDEEAERLTSYLVENAKREFSAPPKGDAAKGAQLMATSGCLNCHAGLPPTTQPKLADTLKGGWTKGCLAANAKARGSAPDFAFTASQRDALIAFAAGGFDSLKQDAPVEFAERQIKNLRCTACHSRDGEPSVWSEVESEGAPLIAAAPASDTPAEGQPIAGAAVPAFTWLGERLQPAWMERFIAGQIAYKPRPWLLARMPGFAPWAHGLAIGLAQQHGLAPADAPTKIDPAKAKIGEQLLGETGGFNCMQCHALGDRAATAVFEQAGVNFAYTHERIRAGFFARWVLAPLRVDPETKMPKFADDEGRTPLTEYFDGKAAEQFEAIRQFLHTLKK